MRKLTTLVFLLLTVVLHAQQITPDEAAAIASEFLNSSSLQITTVKRVGVKRAKAKSDTGDSLSRPYYVFNGDDNQGFVIVSGDKRAKKILGYSDTGNFDFDNLPPQLTAMLEQYAEQIKSLPESTATDPSWSTPTRAASDSEGVLLETANWSQDYPYNLQCPEVDGQRCLTGCVPTAMAIVMKYHNWPDRGRGIHRTPCMDGFIGTNQSEFDFNTEFDYSVMDNIYDENSSAENCNAVAKLMLAAGAASCADYGVDATAASSTIMIRGMIYYLKYSPQMTELCFEGAYSQDAIIKRFTTQELGDSIITQIHKGLPVFGTIYNHMLIIDGYNPDGYFHINFGWGEHSNGFFKLADIIGFSISSIIINVEPDKSGIPISKAHMHDTDIAGINVITFPNSNYPWLNISTANVKKGVAFDCVSGRIYFPTHFIGEYGLAIVDRMNNIKEILWSEELNLTDFDAPWNTNIDVKDLVPTIEIQEEDRIQIVTKAYGENYYALVPSTRQTASSVPCQGYSPKFSEINWDLYDDVGIKAISYSDGKFHSGDKLPDKILKGAVMRIHLDCDYNIYNYNFVNYDVRIAVSVNSEAREICRSNHISLFLMDDISNITIDSYFVDESITKTIVLNNGERLSDKVSPRMAHRMSNMTVIGTLNEDDLKYIDKTFPYMMHLNLKDAEIEDTNKIPANFFHGSNTLKSIRLPKSVKTIGQYAFSYCLMNNVYIPKSVEYIGFEAFGRNPELRELWIEKPLYEVNDLSNAAFYESTQNCILHIPIGELDACKNHYIWGQFANIVPFTPGVIERIEFEENEIEIKVGEVNKLNVTVLPEYYDETVIWLSNDETVANIDANGKITAVGIGEATITATCGSVSATCKVFVVATPAESITLSQTSAQLKAGESITLTATVLPETATDKSVTWSSSDEAVATVDAVGKVTAITVGEATITAYCGSVSADCHVTVMPTLGDSNANGTVNIADAVNTANYAVGNEVENFCFEAADVNGDGEVTVADASGTVTIILAQPVQEGKQGIRLLPAAQPDGADCLRVADYSACMGDTAEISISLDNSIDYVALQADIVLPEGLTIESIVSGIRAAGHTLTTRQLDSRRVRVVLFDLGNSAFADSHESLLDLKVRVEDLNAGDIVMENIIASDASANEYRLASAGGHGNVTTGTDRVPSENVRVEVADGSINIYNATGSTVAIYGADGRVLTRFVAKGAVERYRTAPGVYVVSVGLRKVKVVVK